MKKLLAMLLGLSIVTLLINKVRKGGAYRVG